MELNYLQLTGLILLGLAVGLLSAHIFPNNIKITNDNGTYKAIGLDSQDYTLIIKKGISQKEYADTLIHEACHAFVKNNYDHFCN